MIDDLRRLPRLHAPVFCRPVGGVLFGRRRAIDLSLGGIRLYADDLLAEGDRLELELFLPDETQLICRVEVVWVENLPANAPARFDVSIKFEEISARDRYRLSALLKPD
jgi:c-di-GMP-binding flagellar brake protein YcgR